MENEEGLLLTPDRVNEKEREKMLLHFEKRNFDKKWPNKFLKNVFFNLLFVAVFVILRSSLLVSSRMQVNVLLFIT